MRFSQYSPCRCVWEMLSFIIGEHWELVERLVTLGVFFLYKKHIHILSLVFIKPLSHKGRGFSNCSLDHCNTGARVLNWDFFRHKRGKNEEKYTLFNTFYNEIFIGKWIKNTRASLFRVIIVVLTLIMRTFMVTPEDHGIE